MEQIFYYCNNKSVHINGHNTCKKCIFKYFNLKESDNDSKNQ